MRRGLRTWWGAGEPWYAAVGLANLVLGTSSILVPLMISRGFGESVEALGLLSSLVSLVGVAGSLVWGRLSDVAHRRKPFVILSYAVVGVCLVAIGLASSFSRLMALNMVLQFFWVANASVTVLIVIENRAASGWEGKIGHLNQIGALGWVGGLALGSAWMALAPEPLGETSAIRVLFVVIGVGSVIASLLAWRFVPRTRPRYTRRRYRGVVLAVGNFLIERARFAPFHLYHRLHPRRIANALTRPEGFRPGTKRFLLATLVAFAALGMFGIPLPLLLAERFGLPSASVFVYFLVQHVAIVLAYPLAARRIKRAGNRRVQISSLSARVALFATAAGFLASSGQAPPPWSLVLAFVIYGLTWSYFQLSGVALVSRLAKPENRGMALGLYNALAGVGWIIAGVASGSLAARAGYPLVFAISAGLLVIAVAILFVVPDPAIRPAAVDADRAVESASRSGAQTARSLD